MREHWQAQLWEADTKDESNLVRHTCILEVEFHQRGKSAMTAFGEFCDFQTIAVVGPSIWELPIIDIRLIPTNKYRSLFSAFFCA